MSEIYLIASLTLNLLEALVFASAFDHRVTGLSPAGGEIILEPKQHFIAQSS